MESYDTLTEAMEALRNEGYADDFSLMQNCIESRSKHYQIQHHEFEIDKFFRFEGETDPADESILYAVSSEKYNLKGLLVSAYGAYSEPLEDEMMKKLSFGH